jgi:hypothetical protein
MKKRKILLPGTGIVQVEIAREAVVSKKEETCCTSEVTLSNVQYKRSASVIFNRAPNVCPSVYVSVS